MNIKKYVGGTALGLTSLLPVSCYKQEVKDCINSRKNLLEEVMSDRPQTELNKITSGFTNGDVKVAQIQHSIDSVAFRDMFQGSQLAEDSNFVADYNKMMTKTKTPITWNMLNGKKDIPDTKKLENLLAEKLTVKEMKKAMKSSVIPENGGNGYLASGKQYLVDSVYHHKLFEKYNLLDTNGLKKFTNLCRKVRP